MADVTLSIASAGSSSSGYSDWFPVGYTEGGGAPEAHITGEINTVAIDFSLALTGVNSTLDIGTIVTISAVTIAITGVELVSEFGSITTGAEATQVLSNTVSSVIPGAVTTYSEIEKAITGVESSASVGSIQFVPEYYVGITGTSSTTETGAAVIGFDVVIPLSTAATETVGADAYWGLVELLIHADDLGIYTNSSNYNSNLLFFDQNSNNHNLTFEGSPAIIDSSTKQREISVYGNTYITENQYKFNGYSLEFDGTGDKLAVSVPVRDNTNYTIECWIRPSDITNKQILFASSNTEIYIENSRIYIDNITASPASLVLNQWQHIAICCASGIVRLYVNGIGDTPGTDITTRTITEIGSWNNTNNYIGFMDEIRVTGGATRYYTDFTVPTGVFPEGFIDGGATQINTQVGNVTYEVLAGTALTGVQSNLSSLGEFAEGMEFQLMGNQTDVLTNDVSESHGGSSVLSSTAITTSINSIQATQILDREISSRNYPVPQYEFGTNTAYSDPYFTNVSLLLNADYDNGNTAGNFYDRSNNNLTVTKTGDATLTTAQSVFGGSSAYFDGSGDTVSVTHASLFNFGSSDFTIDGWIRLASGSGTYKQIIGTRTGDSASTIRWGVAVVNNYLHAFAYDTNSVSIVSMNSAAGTIPNDTWVHFAWVRSGNNWTLYINGASVSTATGSGSVVNTNTTVNIGHAQPFSGAYLSTNGPFKGHIDELRVTKGVARWTSNFSVPTISAVDPALNYDEYYSNVKYLLHANGTNGSTNITDSSSAPKTSTAVGNAQLSTAQYKFGTSSIYLDGIGDHVVSATSTDFNIGSNDFTIECWANIEAFTNTNPHFITISDGVGNNEVRLLTDNTSKTVGGIIYHSGAYKVNVFGTTVLQPNTWYHLAFVRKGNNHSIFVNGVLEATVTVSHTWTYSNPVVYVGWIGLAGDAYRMRGWIDEVRITTNVARYFDRNIVTQINTPSVSLNYGITGNESTLSIGSVSLDARTGQVSGYGQTGTISVSQSLDRELNSNESIVYLGNLGLPLFVAAITGNQITVQQGTLTDNLTDNFASKVTSTGAVGNITTSAVAERNLTSNQITVYQGNLGAPTLTASITGNSLTTETGTIFTELSETILNKVSSSGQVGSITTSIESERALTSSEITTNVGSVGAQNVSAIAGTESYTSVGSVIGYITEHFATKVFAQGQIGTITTSSTSVRNITGNQSTLAINNVISTNTSALTKNTIVTGVGSIVAGLTSNYINKVTSNTGVGSIVSSQTLTRNLTSSAITGTAGLIVQDFLTPQTGNSTTLEIGDVTPLLTETFAAPVTSQGQVGIIVTTNTQEKSLNSQSYRSVATGYVGNITTTQTIQISSDSIITQVNSVSAELTENFASPVISTGNVGIIGLQNTGTVSLFGLQATVSSGTVEPTKFAALTSPSINTNIGNLVPKISLGVSTKTAVGSITTSAVSSRDLTGVQTTGSVNEVRNYKYSQLTGNSTAVEQGFYADVAHSLGVICYTGKGSVGVSISIDTYPNGNQTTGQVGTVFATQTIEITGVSGTGEVNTSPDVQHSLGVITYTYAGSMKYTHEYGIIGKQATVSAGNIGTRQTLSRALTEVHSTCKLYEEATPYYNKLGEHREIDIPASYSIKLQGEFSYITNFECTNSNSDLIEIYFNNNLAWVKLNTPGSFQSMTIYYTNLNGTTGTTTVLEEVPSGAEVYNIVQTKIDRLEFKAIGVYDDGFGPVPLEKIYVIDILTDYSIERDQLALTL